MIGRTVLILYLLLFTPENPGLSAEDKPYNTKPYDFAASEIIGNKVVMLAENGALGHYNLFPYITFIKIIKSWNAQLKEEKIHNKTLSLIIEKSPKAVSLIRHYIDSGDIDPFLDKMGNSSSLEELYLFYKLKELNKEIIRNGNRLKISGFEISERYEDEYFFKRSE